jgi:dTDP-4-dehydrorhamnose 3,5-epimerase
MIFTETKLRGAYVIDIERREDERGFFARTFCRDEFAAHNLKADWVQCNISFNARRGTLRGMHYQAEPFAETKLVRCTQGAAYDVIIDLRPESVTFKEWVAIELTAENRRAVYIPEGFAHGFQTLTDGVELFYQMSQFYQAGGARGVRWNDAAFRIRWVDDGDLIINEKDRTWADFAA